MGFLDRLQRVIADGDAFDDPLPDEVWYKCPDCNGDGRGDVMTWDDDNPEAEGTLVDAICGECDGSGVIEGDVHDMDLAKALGWERVDP